MAQQRRVTAQTLSSTVTFCPLLAVLGLLHGRPAAVGPGKIFLLLGLGPHLTIGRLLLAALAEVDAVHQYIIEIRHGLS